MIKKGLKKYIPDSYYKTIQDIDFLHYYNEGKRLIFLDIDNTVVNYDVLDPSKEHIDLINHIKDIGFEIIIISNNNEKRVERLSAPLNVKYVYTALKPLKKGYKQGLKIADRSYKKDEIMAIGDQLMTDIKGANKMGFYSILVTPIERKTDVFTTRVNRYFENRRINKIKKKYPEIYEQRLKDY